MELRMRPLMTELTLYCVICKFYGGQRDIAIQLAGGYKIILQKFRLTGGVGYRIGDAIELLAGMDIKNTKIGISYDVSLNPINLRVVLSFR